MVISFSSEKARTFLLEHGSVYTFRKNRRKQFVNQPREDALMRRGIRDWANKGRTMKKITDVKILEVGEFKVAELEPYVEWSGFKDLKEWADEILKLTRWTFYIASDRGWLYKVVLRVTEVEN